jgi:hypothetical protein
MSLIDIKKQCSSQKKKSKILSHTEICWFHTGILFKECSFIRNILKNKTCVTCSDHPSRLADA